MGNQTSHNKSFSKAYPSIHEYVLTEDFKELSKAAYRMGVSLYIDYSTKNCCLEYKYVGGSSFHEAPINWGKMPVVEITYVLFRRLVNIIPDNSQPIGFRSQNSSIQEL